MRRCLLLLVLWVPINAAVAQGGPVGPVIDWSASLNEKVDGRLRQILSASGSGVVVWLERKNEQVVRRLDGALRTVYSKPLEPKLTTGERILEQLMVIGDRLYLFTSGYDKRSETRSLFAKGIEIGNYGTVLDERVIASMRTEGPSLDKFTIWRTRGQNRIEVRVNEMGYKEKHSSTYSLLLDTDLNDIQYVPDEHDRVVQAQLPVDFYEDAELTDRKGSRYYLGRRYPTGTVPIAELRGNDPVHSYWLLIYGPNDTVPEEHVIGIKDKFLQEMTFAETSKGDIMCAGFYGNKGSWSIRGAFALRISGTTKDIINEQSKEFTDDLITQGMSRHQAERAERKAVRKDEELEMENYRLDHLVAHPDGHMQMVAEAFYTTSVCGGSVCHTHVHCDDIIVVDIDAEGGIGWVKKIPKRQHTVDSDVYAGYRLFASNDRLHFIFNDDPYIINTTAQVIHRYSYQCI